MLPSKYHRAVALSIIALPLALSQFVSSLPACVQDCINQSQDDNCSATDIACLCRASAGNFLPDLITCIHGQCDNDLDNNLLLTPLQWACDLAGAPIPASAIRNAENQASSLAAQVTMTVTMPASGAVASTAANPSSCASGYFGCAASVGGGCCPSGYGCGTASCSLPAASTTTEAGSVTTETITTTQSGSIIALAYPVTKWSTTTVSGSPSTVTSVSTDSMGFTSLVSIVITSTNSAGSTYTSTTTQKPSSSSSSSPSSASSDTSVSSSTTVTTSVAAEKTSGTQAQTKTSAAPNADATDSAPFKNTNGSAKTNVANWLGFSVLLVVGCVWF